MSPTVERVSFVHLRVANSVELMKGESLQDTLGRKQQPESIVQAVVKAHEGFPCR